MASFTTFASILVFGLVALGANGESDLSRLANYIKNQSDPDVIPPSNGTLVVESGFTIFNIADVDHERNVVEYEGEAMDVWSCGVTWNSSEYGNHEFITLPSKYFWIPPLVDVTSAVKIEEVSPPFVTLFSNGTILRFAMYRPKMLCDVSNIASTAGATCMSKHMLWGYTKNDVILDVQQVPPRYFAGSKYEILSDTFALTDVVIDGQTFQMGIATTVIREKPQNHNHHGPFRALFQFGH